jgi:hypothetical protein
MCRTGHGRSGHRGDGGEQRHTALTRNPRHFRPLAIPAYDPLQQSRFWDEAARRLGERVGLLKACRVGRRWGGMNARPERRYLKRFASDAAV